MGFTRPHYRTAATTVHTRSQIFEKTIISDARLNVVAKSSSSSSRLRFSPKSSQASNCTNPSKTHNRATIKRMKMLSTIVALLLITIKPATAATTSMAIGEQTKILLLWFNNLLETLSTFITSTTTFTATSIIPKLTLLSSSTTTTTTATPPTYQLTKILFLRTLALVHLAAFSVAKFQNRGLIGDNGIAPARHVLNDSEARQRQRSVRRQKWVEDRKNYNNKGNWIQNALLDSRILTRIRDKFWYRTDRADRLLPSLLWLAPNRTNLNPWLTNLSNVGLLLSTIMLLTGSANAFLILALWWIQRSFMSVGGVFYGFGWEPQLAELSFHALFLVPLLRMGAGGWLTNGSNNGVVAVPTLVIWAIRFYLFKIMLGAGLIKLKSSDDKWKPGNMSTMYYFYETQPVPNPFSKYFHFMPKAWHRFEVWMNHFVELIAPFLLLSPFRKWRIGGAMIQIMFQLTLITSGNLSFLNWLTIAPAILCLDDAFLMNNLPEMAQKVLLGTPTTSTFSLVASLQSGSMQVLPTPISRKIVSVAFFLLMAKLNVKVVKNLLSRRQLMNASFDKLRLAGSYGAFGVVCEERDELIIESASDPNGPWKEYNFKVKPGNVDRKPRWISPYHYRLDWQMWIAAQTGRIERNPWMLSFLLKLLQQEKDVVDLLESDPWAESNVSPKYIRVDKYRYSFNKKDKNSESKSSYWKRERIGRYFPYGQGVLTEEMLKDIIKGLR